MVLPAATDLGDPALYYLPNIAILENEVPARLLGALPGSPAYDGQVVVIDNSYSVPYASRLAYVGNGGVWVPWGNFSQEALEQVGGTLNNTWSELTPNASGSELYETNPWNIGVTSLAMPKNFVWKLELQSTIQPVGANFTGNITVLIDPTTSTQPTPGTGTALSWKFPVTTQNGTTNQTRRGFFNTLWYNPGSSAVANPGVAIYLSAVQGQAKAVQVTAPGTFYARGTSLIATGYPR